jgi:hypothetical protein
VAAGGHVEVGPAELDDAPQDVVDVELGSGEQVGRRLASDRLGGEGDAQRWLGWLVHG